MTIETITEYGEPNPEPERDDPTLQAQAVTGQTTPADAGLQAHATDTITHLLQKHPRLAKDIRDTLRARVHLGELAERTNRAEKAEADTEQHESNLAVKLDPGDRRTLGFALGLSIIVALVILDAVPLNWAAQAFGLNSAGTWLVTFILVVASIGAMLGFEITRGHPRRRGVLTAVVTVAYLALFGLRTEFLITVSSDSLPVALLQSALLTAISAGLVLCGSAIPARTRFLSPSRARAAARRAAQAADDARAAERVVHEIAAHMRIHGRRAIHLVADLALDEAPVNPVLSQVRDVGMPHRMNDQGRRQAQGAAVGDKPGVDLGRLDPPAAFGHPQRRMPGAAEPGPDVLHVIGHGVYRPGHHRRDVTAPRRLPAFGLAITHVEHAVPAELRRGRVAAEVGDIQLRRLRPAQPFPGGPGPVA